MSLTSNISSRSIFHINEIGRYKYTFCKTIPPWGKCNISSPLWTELIVVINFTDKCRMASVLPTASGRVNYSHKYMQTPVNKGLQQTQSLTPSHEAPTVPSWDCSNIHRSCNQTTTGSNKVSVPDSLLRKKSIKYWVSKSHPCYVVWPMNKPQSSLICN